MRALALAAALLLGSCSSQGLRMPAEVHHIEIIQFDIEP